VLQAAAENCQIMLLTADERNYYVIMKAELGKHPCEIACVGAGLLGGGCLNTQELCVMKLGQAMKTKDKEEHWEEGVGEEHNKMLKYKVWEAVPCGAVPKGNKILMLT
jgi:hypothetical protein